MFVRPTVTCMRTGSDTTDTYRMYCRYRMAVGIMAATVGTERRAWYMKVVEQHKAVGTWQGLVYIFETATGTICSV